VLGQHSLLRFVTYAISLTGEKSNQRSTENDRTGEDAGIIVATPTRYQVEACHPPLSPPIPRRSGEQGQRRGSRESALMMMRLFLWLQLLASHQEISVFLQRFTAIDRGLFPMTFRVAAQAAETNDLTNSGFDSFIGPKSQRDSGAGVDCGRGQVGEY
jgi:hypothetical protein